MAKEIKYKVVRREAQTIKSFVAYMFPNYRVIYQKNKWVEAPIGGLFVFDTLKNAEMFAHGYGEIWECEVQQHIPLPRLNAINVRESIIPKIWQNNFNGSWGTAWPPGTEAYKKVKLIKLLNPQTKETSDPDDIFNDE